jgi:hypothetical protein
VPEVALDLLAKPQIKLPEAPGLRCVEPVYEDKVKICRNCTSTVRTIIRCCRAKLGLTHVPQELQPFPRPTFAQLLHGLTSAYAQPHRHPGCIHQQQPPCICDSSNKSSAYAASISGLQWIWTPLSGEKTVLCLTLCADHACDRPSRNFSSGCRFRR